jgi:CheY-like chemotaxis protein
MARILIIDDNDLLRVTVKAMVESGGHEAALAADGEEGLQLFREQTFDLVVCDIFMPRMEGFETVRALRRLSAETPIISMTGGRPPGAPGGDQADPDFLKMTGALGATRTIAKPFRAGELLALIEECLSLRAAGS